MQRHCSGQLAITLQLDDKLQQSLDNHFTKLMKALFRQKGALLDIDILASEDAQQFIDTHAAILDSTFEKVGMSDKMRNRLKSSDYIFSGIKTFHELNEAFPSLIDENGKRKPFERFLKDVQTINETYNKNYLQAEYNFVHSSANMAAKWEQFMEDGDRYDLQYRTAGDTHVRPAHAELNGITLPPSDAFWESYYPPNGWNCRCTVVQVRKAKYEETPHDEAMSRGQAALGDDKKGMFRFNSGKEEKTVPDYNAYTIRHCRYCDIAKNKTNLSKPLNTDLCKGCQLVRSLEAKKEKNYELFEKYRANKDYIDVDFDAKRGGFKATHKEHNLDKNKGWYEETVRNIGYKHGHTVVLEKEQQDEFQKRHCEGLWDGKKFEIAGSETATENNIRNGLKHCVSKPDTKIAVLFFPNDNFTRETFERAYAKFYGLKGTSQYKKFDLIYCIDNNRIIYIKKPDD